MPRIARLITSFSGSEIVTLLKSAKTAIRCPGLDIRVAPASGAIARVLVVTPRKMGIAPERNKIRRRIKAIFYQQQLFARATDMVVYCKKESATLSFQELNNCIMTAIAKERISCYADCSFPSSK